MIVCPTFGSVGLTVKLVITGATGSGSGTTGGDWTPPPGVDPVSTFLIQLQHLVSPW